MNVNPVPVTIIDDNIHENNETFLGTLTATGQPAILNPDTTVITIIDDNDREIPYYYYKLFYDLNIDFNCSCHYWFS